MAGEAVGVDRGRGHDQLQVGPARQDLLQIAEQEIDIETALVRLVDDDRVVGGEQRIGLRFGEQDAVGHQLDRCAGREVVGETHLVADHFAERRAEFLGDAPPRRRCRDPARLRMADQAGAARAQAASEREADLRKLRRLAGAGFAADDDDLMRFDRPRDFLATAGDRQRFGERDRRDRVRLDDASFARGVATRFVALGGLRCRGLCAALRRRTIGARLRRLRGSLRSLAFWLAVFGVLAALLHASRRMACGFVRRASRARRPVTRRHIGVASNRFCGRSIAGGFRRPPARGVRIVRRAGWRGFCVERLRRTCRCS